MLQLLWYLDVCRYAYGTGTFTGEYRAQQLCQAKDYMNRCMVASMEYGGRAAVGRQILPYLSVIGTPTNTRIGTATSLGR